MRFSTSALIALLATGALAVPYRHPHHFHKREVVTSAVVVYTTVTVEDDGAASATSGASESAAATTVAVAATSTFVGDASSVSSAIASVQSANSDIAQSSFSTIVTSSSSAPAPYSTVYNTSSSVASSSATFVTSTTSSSSSASARSSASATSSAASSSSTGSTSTFQDGVYSCTDFPSDQNGVVALDYLGYGGYTGIQIGDAAGSSCTEGAYCSYACKPGMLKSQWPTEQPSDGESRGGLLCKNGKLYRTNTAYDSLCIDGVGSAYVENRLSQGVAICQTDYPGSENMVIPTYVEGGAYSPLSVVDSDTYYKWQGKSTSSQFYVNKAGYSQQKGCQWATSDDDYGNWSPVNFGAGQSNGVTYLSIIQNPLTTAVLNYKVKIVATEGSTVSGECVYDSGSFTGGSSSGCTVGVTSGSAKFVLYN
ncbi:cell wall protein Psu1 [Schizosaccharomyces japonicus yFS275]|uniref:Cell wall protein Psu1 n=1 Tax=Schizosaccharomyces japonicus (strain yFS275 / FY16936) TaxID=402676 RepID=B6K3V3_SCHJY|nr:cell wall protein Psu1 [Schizosaccharomyces japonicus yFS275]EEB08160.1 cell wall protein Psu1 [Schizosaccharomyces japonicus yFS275]